MEYVPGGTLEERIRKDGPLPAPEAAALAAQIARALQAAHQKEIIHRDVRPRNVLLTEDGQAKVADFGIARAAYETALTQEGSILGNAHYLSPEQALGQPLSPRSDLYSLGVTLYRMVTGETPFDADTPVAVVMKHVGEEPHPPKDVNQSVPDDLDAIVVRLLSKDPDARYQNAKALVEDLEWVLRSRNRDEVAVESPVSDSRAIGSAATVPQDKELPSVEVPELFGLNRFEADETLASTGLTLCGQRETSSDVVPEGMVVIQYPAAGTKAKQGSSVSVTISAGSAGGARHGGAMEGTITDDSGSGRKKPQRVRVPDLAGKNPAQASGVLKNAGLEYLRNSRIRSEAPKYTIIEQDPAAGTEVDRNSAVAVTISAGRRRKWPWVLAAILATFGLAAGIAYAAWTEPVYDDSETLRVRVPSGWSETSSARWSFEDDTDVGPTITAAPNLENITDSYDDPGAFEEPQVFFGASDELLEDYSTVGLINYYEPSEQCDAQGPEDYDDGTYTGYMEVFENCGGTETSVTILAAAPEDESYVVLVYMQLVGEPDDAIVKDLVLKTFEVLDENNL